MWIYDNEPIEEESIDENYIIPNAFMPNIEKRVNKVQNKGVPVQFDILDRNVQIPVYIRPRHPNDRPIGYCPCTKIRVHGEYKINNWDLVAKIDHETANDDGNQVVLHINKNIPIPEEYYSARSTCDYCHTERLRKSTYVLYNKEENKYIHVGSECLTYFTNGLSVNSIASFYDVIGVIEKDNIDYEGILVGKADDFYEQIESTINKPQIVCDVDTVLYCANELVNDKHYSYIKGSALSKGTTAEKVYYEAVNTEDNMKLPSDIDSAFKQYVEMRVYMDYGDYWQNVNTLLKRKYIEQKYISFLVSALHVYYLDKWKNEAKAKELSSVTNEYIGQVGERITFTIKDWKCVFSGESSYDNNYYHTSWYYVYIITTDKGYKLKWTTSKEIDESEMVGSTCKATIKELSNYRGAKQTIITRCNKV